MGQENSYNLCLERWLPAISVEGQPVGFTLVEALQSAHRIRRLNLSSPLVEYGVYYFLMACLMAIAREQGWSQVDLLRLGWLPPETVKGYFSARLDRFDLFSRERPFYQTPAQVIDRRCRRESSALAQFFTKAKMGTSKPAGSRRPLAPAQVAAFLLALQRFAGGNRGPDLDGQGLHPAPGAAGINFMVERPTLFERLIFNMYDEPGWGLNPQRDAPVWDRNLDWLAAKAEPDGLLDYLTWPARIVLASPEPDEQGQPVVVRLLYGQGLKVDTGKVFDPWQAYCQYQGEGWRPLKISAGHQSWRDGATIFGMHFREDSPELATPDFFRGINQLFEAGMVGEGEALRIRGVSVFPRARYRHRVDLSLLLEPSTKEGTFND